VTTPPTTLHDLPDRLDRSAARLRETVDPASFDDEGADEACAVADIFEAAAALIRRTPASDRGTEVEYLLWRIVTLERLILAAEGPTTRRRWART